MKKKNKRNKKKRTYCSNHVSPSFGPVSWAPTIFPSHFEYNSYITMYCLVSIEKEPKKKKKLTYWPNDGIAIVWTRFHHREPLSCRFRCKTYISIYYLVSIEKE